MKARRLARRGKRTGWTFRRTDTLHLLGAEVPSLLRASRTHETYLQPCEIPYVPPIIFPATPDVPILKPKLKPTAGYSTLHTALIAVVKGFGAACLL